MSSKVQENKMNSPSLKLAPLKIEEEDSTLEATKSKNSGESPDPSPLDSPEFSTDSKKIVPLSKKAKEDKEEKALPLKSPFKFWLMIIDLSMPMFYAGQNFMIISFLFSTLKLEENYNWVKNENLYLSLAVSSLFVGMIAGGLLSRVFRRFNPSIVYLVALSLLMICYLGCLSKITWILLPSRVLTGIALNVMITFAMSMIFENSPNRRRRMTSALPGFFLTLGIASESSKLYLISSGWLNWQSSFYINMILMAVHIILSMIFLPFNKSVSYGLKNNQEKKVERRLMKFMQKGDADKLINGQKEAMEKIQESSSRNKIEPAQSCEVRVEDEKTLVKKMDKKWDAFYGILVAVLYLCSFSSIFSPYIIIFITEDLEDEAELRISTIFLNIATALEISVKILTITWKPMQNWARTFFVGKLLMGLLTFLLGLCYYFELYTVSKFLGLMYYPVIGAMNSTPFFGLLPQLLPMEVLGLVFTVNGVFDLLSVFISPFIFPVTKSVVRYTIGAFVLAGINLFTTAFMPCFLFNPNGMGRLEIHENIKRKMRFLVKSKKALHNK